MNKFDWDGMRDDTFGDESPNLRIELHGLTIFHQLLGAQKGCHANKNQSDRL